uniref:BTB domain-containing protein n=1 Tax=Panagrolaimus sp. ES5 TaxID=591445 RepID=A0AC34FHV8_9BILA
MDESPVFSGMFESGMKETIENKMIIPDFSFKIVDAVMKLFYNCVVAQTFNLEDLLLLYQFADKYQMTRIMDLLENYFIKKISPSNIVQLEKFSTDFYAKKLHQSCIDFLIKCSEQHTPILGAESLDKDLVFEMFMSTLRSNGNPHA